MPSFRIAPHGILAAHQCVEIRDDEGRLLAAVYANDAEHIKVVSKYIEGAVIDELQPPAVMINLRKA